MFKIVILPIVILALLCSEVRSDQSELTTEDMQRIKVIKEAVGGVDPKSLDQMMNEFQKADHPQISLAIKEAMARTYTDIVVEENVKGQKKKEWLYSMIALNMAYFQFGGDKDSADGAKNLNKLIRFKLKSYLPSDIYKKPGFICNLG